MNKTGRQIASLLILTFMALMLFGCANLPTKVPKFPSAPDMIESPNPAYDLAQATMDYGQRQLLDLSQNATQVSLNMSQAENAAMQSTQEYNQRQKMDLDYQATVISRNIAQAAATQEFIAQQANMARDATIIAQSIAAAATQSAYLVNVTQTAQAQAILDARVMRTDQAVAALTAYPLTATPFAVTKAALLMKQYDREQRSFVDQIVVPLIPVLAILDILLITLGIVFAYRRYLMSTPRPRRLRIARVNTNPIPVVIVDGLFTRHGLQLHRTIPSELTPANSPRLPGRNAVHVEIVNATEPPVAHWIAEVEHQLANKEGG